jgi:hypothetical protein
MHGKFADAVVGDITARQRSEAAMRRLGSEEGQRGHAGTGWRSRSRRVTATRRHPRRNGLKPELLLLEDRRLLSTFTVTKTADDGSSNTLRWAVAQANAATTASSIEIELGSSAATIALTKKAHRKLHVKTLGTISVNGGAATLTLKPKKVLRKAITIVYSGNDDFLASQLIPPKLTKKQLKSLAQPLS